MGNFCCCKHANTPYSKGYDVKALDNNDIQSSIDSPTNKMNNNNSNSLETNRNHIATNTPNTAGEKINLFNEKTLTLDNIANSIINILSIYHLFINNYDINLKNNANLINKINNKIDNEINDETLRNYHYHLMTYYHGNKKLMKLLFETLMDKNNSNGIENLEEINEKLNNDQQKQNYFGHKMDDEIAMIQTLNKLHFDCVNGDYYNDDDPEIDDDIQENDDDQQMLMNQDDDDNDKNNINNKKRRKYKKFKNKNNKNVNNTNNDNEDEKDASKHIDVKYEPNSRERRKIGLMCRKYDVCDVYGVCDMIYTGRLKLKKPKPKQDSGGKYKAKAKQVKGDDSWMNKQYQKKSKHVVSESIQMLGATKLVSGNSFKHSLDSLAEEQQFDLSNIDLDVDIQQFSNDSHDHHNMKKKKEKKKDKEQKKKTSSMFADDYEVDQ